MDKNKIKSFAIWARRAMIQAVSDRAYKIGIEKDLIQKAEAIQGGFRLQGKEEIFNFPLTERIKLEALINEKGYEQVMEEVAYTWFNRFMGLRYMEVNDYLPIGIRILSSEVEGKREPDVLNRISEVIEELELKGNEIYSLLDTGKNEDREKVYRKILVAQCNKLGEIIPQMFEKITDYTELLLPDNLLSEGSVIDKMVNDIDEEDWKEEVEIIGWMYQYYISEKKDEVFAALKKNVKITKENIPAATQLFTPKWIVKYMVENSLGRLWLEGHPNKELQEQFKYYLEEAEQEDEVEEEIAKIREEHAKLNPEDIKILDPCMGSGHILVYAFDVLYQIYLSAGYSEREIPRKILENNLYGLDIDDRAAQLAAFALIMKARHYNRRLFREIDKDQIKFNICSIVESNRLNNWDAIQYFSSGDKELELELKKIIDTFINAKQYGSTINCKKVNYERLEKRLTEVEYDNNIIFADYRKLLVSILPNLIMQSRICARKYEVCITNPPYLGRKGMNLELASYLDKEYPKSKNDLFAAFIDNLKNKSSAYCALVTQHAWMFLSSFERLRGDILERNRIVNMCHIGTRGFEELNGEVVQTTAFILAPNKVKDYTSSYCKLTDVSDKEASFSNKENLFRFKQENFYNMPNNVIAYWVSDTLRDIFIHADKMIKYMKPLAGISSGKNEVLIRNWYEVNEEKIGTGYYNRNDALASHKKWYFHNKGGDFRRWYGNLYNIFNYTKESIKYMEKLPGFRHDNREEYFKIGLNWAKMSSGRMGVRYTDCGCVFDSAGTSGFPIKYTFYIQGLLNSAVAEEVFAILNPTLSIVPGNVADFPVVIPTQKNIEEIEDVVKECIDISKMDWDSFETSREFKYHPMITSQGTEGINRIEDAYNKWSNQCEQHFKKLKNNEEYLNKIFIQIYGLNKELSYKVKDKNISIKTVDRIEAVKSLISYIVGCVFGRYSLDKPGIVYAGGSFDGKWSIQDRMNSEVKEDNIIPITNEEYFDKDIIVIFTEYIEKIYGKENLEINLDFIANSLDRKDNETSRQTLRRYFIKEFYKDHLKMYQKTPIYWLLDSGKENGFKALIYMHRYDESTIAKVRTDYLHVLQRKYEAEVQRLQLAIEAPGISAKDKVANTKKMDKLKKQIQECIEYDQVVKHLADEKISIDLDDGVKVNYAKFQDVKVINSAGKEVKMNLLAKI